MAQHGLRFEEGFRHGLWSFNVLYEGMLLSLDKGALLQEGLRYALISTGIHLVTMLAASLNSSSSSHLEFLIFTHGLQTL